MENSLAFTPLTQWHKSQKARMAEFAGYSMPIQYTSIVAEHTATRQQAGLFDISHMGRIRFEGGRADQLLDHLLTRRVTDLQPGMIRYSLMCNAEGGILDDVLVSCLESPSGRQIFLLVVNASNRAKITKWLAPHASDFPDVAVNDVTDTTAMIAIQGPNALSIAGRIFPKQVDSLKYYRGLITQQMGKPCIVSRTGYTGEDGLEMIIRAEDAPRVWENLLLAGRDQGIVPVGLAARDTLRLEAGMPLYGHELNESIDPYQAGLGFAVNLQGRKFVGCEALADKGNDQSTPVRVGLKLSGKRVAREGAEIFDADRRRIGYVTSGTFAPTLDCPIAMAYVSRSSSPVGQSVDVDIRGSKTEAQVVPLPFYKRSTTNQ